MDAYSLLPEIRRNVKGCPDLTMIYALNRAARMFCSDSWICRRKQIDTLVVGQQQYPFNPPANEEVICIKHAMVQFPAPSNSVIGMQVIYGEFINPNWGPSCPRALCMIPYTNYYLDRKPDQAYILTIEYVTQPIMEGNYIPDELGVRYVQALGYGALEYLLMMPNCPWSNPQQAAFYGLRFNQEIAKARGEAAFDFSPGTRQWVRSPFIRSRNGGWL